jgi:hypothetical protein
VNHKPGSVCAVQSLASHLAIIPLESSSPRISSSLPRDTDGSSLSVPIRGLAPDGVCLATFVTEGAVGSYPTVSPFPFQFAWSGGLFSVALSLKLPSPGITRRPALRSPDFPPNQRFSDRLRHHQRDNHDTARRPTPAKALPDSCSPKARIFFASASALHGPPTVELVPATRQADGRFPQGILPPRHPP